MKVITVYSTKGGVGKTTTAVNLAWEAAQHSRVVIWDLDPQGASTFLLGVKAKLKAGADALVRGKTSPKAAIRSTSIPGLDLIPADLTYRDLDLMLDATKNSLSRVGKVAAALAGDYDILVLDCPPGESLVARNALEAADVIVVPMPPSPLARRSLEQIRTLRDEGRTGAHLIGFLSMVDRRKTVHRMAVEELPTDDIVAIVVPAASVVERMGAEQAPIATFAPTSPAAVAYRELWTVIRVALKIDPAGKPSTKAKKKG